MNSQQNHRTTQTHWNRNGGQTMQQHHQRTVPINQQNVAAINHLEQPKTNALASNSHVQRDGYFNLKSHGNACAINFAPSESQKQWKTLNIEGAQRKNPNNPNDKTYNWENKIIVQVTKSELPEVACVLLGLKSKVEFKNHGNTKKSYSLENQGSHFLCRMYEKDKNAITCPIPLVEGMMAGTLALTRFTMNFPTLTTDTALQTLRIMCHNQNQHSQQKNHTS